MDKNKDKKKLTRMERFALVRQQIEERLSEEIKEPVVQETEIKIEKKEKVQTDPEKGARIAFQEAYELVAKYREQGLYKDIEADPDEIDQAFEDMKKEEFV